MRPPSPDDMIYCGLILKLGIASEEEIRNLTRIEQFRDSTFIEIMRTRGFLTEDQDKAIQSILARMAQAEIFRRGGTGPVTASLAMPATRPAPTPSQTAPPSPPPETEAPTVVQGAPLGTEPATAAPGGATVVSDMMDTVVTSASRGGPTSAVDWSTLTGELSREDLQRAQRKRIEWGDSMIGEQIGGYTLLDRLGRGGMGDVYLAKQLSLNRYVALKVLPPGLARSKGFVGRFVREAQTLARIAFASITQVYDVGEKDGTLYFTMELVKGKTLHELIKESRTLPVEMAINVVKQSCRALARVAKEGIIHRDIKPGNIMLSEAGEIKVCDFGIATEAIDEEGRREIVGTPRYISPEYLMGAPCTSQADQYSLGVTFYDMLAGLPKKTAGGTAGLIDGSMAFLSDINSAVPREIAEIVARMTRPTPEERFADFESIYRALEDYEIRAGLIATPSEFLADRLVDMRELNWARVKQAAMIWAGVAALVTAIAGVVNRILLQASLAKWLGWLGGWGTIMIFVAYGMILYVGLARKKILPAMGNLKTWVENHYRLALTGYFCVMIHSGNFIAWPLIRGALARIPGLGADKWGTVPTVPFLCSLALFLVIISGLIGRFIFRELHRQLALQRFGENKNLSADDRLSLTRLVIGTRIMGYWRVLHYPMTVLMILLVVAHVVAALYYGGSFFGGR